MTTLTHQLLAKKHQPQILKMRLRTVQPQCRTVAQGKTVGLVVLHKGRQ